MNPIQFLLTILALFISQLLIGLMYSLFKANKYEDVLADKIAQMVIEEIRKERK